MTDERYVTFEIHNGKTCCDKCRIRNFKGDLLQGEIVSDDHSEILKQLAESSAEMSNEAAARRNRGDDELPGDENDPRYKADIGDAIETLMLGQEAAGGDIGYARDEEHEDQFIAEHYGVDAAGQFYVAVTRKYKIVEVKD